MCFDHDEFADVWRESHPKARKDYKCVECCRPIKKGEVYHCMRSLFEGSWTNTRECAKCEHARALVQQVETDRGCVGNEAICPFYELGEAISEDNDGYGLIKRDDDNDLLYARPEVMHLFPDALPMK